MMTTPSVRTLRPHLIVAGAARAIDFYAEVFGATESARYTDPKRGGHIVHAELSIGNLQFTLAEEQREQQSHAPTSLGGSPVILTLEVDDARAVGARMEQAGARVVYPIQDQFYGKREGRLADPFGHLWIISQPLETLSREEIQRRLGA